MTRLRLLVAICLTMLVTFPASAEPSAGAETDEPLHLLFFGNSFTMGGVADHVGHLATAAGHATPTIVAHLHGGQSLTYHLEAVEASPEANVAHERLADGQWDYIILQEFSTRPTHIGEPDAFRRDALALHEAMQAHPSGRGANVSTVLYQTWARAPGNAFFPTRFEDPAAMQAQLREHYAQARDDINAAHGPGAARVAPVGDGYEAMDFDLVLYADDLYHQGRAGTVLASMVIFRTIYETPVGDVPFAAVEAWARVDEALWERLAGTADGLDLD